MEQLSYRLKLVTAADGEPLTASQLVAMQARIDPSALQLEGGLIDSYISTERKWVEAQTGRQLLPATYEVVLDRFPCATDVICLPRPPLRSVESIKYLDDSNVLQTLSTDDYIVEKPASDAAAAECERGRIWLAFGKTWPSTLAIPGAVVIKIVAGYKDTDHIPPSLIGAIVQRVAERYQFREDQTTGTIVAPNSITSLNLVSPYRDFGNLIQERS